MPRDFGRGSVHPGFPDHISSRADRNIMKHLRNRNDDRRPGPQWPTLDQNLGQRKRVHTTEPVAKNICNSTASKNHLLCPGMSSASFSFTTKTCSVYRAKGTGTSRNCQGAAMNGTWSPREDIGKVGNAVPALSPRNATKCLEKKPK